MVEVCGAEAAVPEIGGGVFVRDEEDGEGGGRGGCAAGGRQDGVRGGGRVMFLGVRGEGFGKGGAVGSAGEGKRQFVGLSEGRRFLGYLCMLGT